MLGALYSGVAFKMVGDVLLIFVVAVASLWFSLFRCITYWGFIKSFNKPFSFRFGATTFYSFVKTS